MFSIFRRRHLDGRILLGYVSLSAYRPEKTPVSDPHRRYEVRCPVHGFIPINDWEREIINQPAFQRLRRIRQLAWTDYVYPGAMHTRSNIHLV